MHYSINFFNYETRDNIIIYLIKRKIERGEVWHELKNI